MGKMDLIQTMKKQHVMLFMMLVCFAVVILASTDQPHKVKLEWAGSGNSLRKTRINVVQRIRERIPMASESELNPNGELMNEEKQDDLDEEKQDNLDELWIDEGGEG